MKIITQLCKVKRRNESASTIKKNKKPLQLPLLSGKRPTLLDEPSLFTFHPEIVSKTAEVAAINTECATNCNA